MSGESTAVATTDTGIESSETSTELKVEETPAQVQANKKKYMLKVDGEDIEEEIDLNDDVGMTKRLQMARAAEKRMKSAATEKQKAFEIIKAFESDPESMLKRLGPKGREIAEKFLLAQIQDDMLTPEEKEFRQLKQENETYKQKEAREKEERAQAEQQKKEYEYAQTFQATIISALEKSGLPKTAVNVKRMASVMSKNLEYGLELTPDDLATEVFNERSEELKAIIKDADGDQLIKMFGEEMANKIRRSDLKKLQERQGQVFQPGKRTNSGSAPGPKSKGYTTMDEWKEQIERNIKE